MYNRWPSFDELKQLAEHSPEKLEEFRKREIDRLISRAPKEYQKRLRGIQFQVNCQRQLHNTPLGSCVAISRMMHESVTKLGAVLSGKSYPATSFAEPSENNVIPFAG